MGNRLKKNSTVAIFLLLSILLFGQTPRYANASKLAFPYLEALGLLDSMCAISSLSYVVSEQSVKTITDNQTVVVDTSAYPPIISIASTSSSFILVDKEEYSQLLIEQKRITKVGDTPLSRLTLLLKIGRLFGKEQEATRLYQEEVDAYHQLTDYLYEMRFTPKEVTLYSQDEYYISLFSDANVLLFIQENPPSSEIIFSVDGKYYSFDKRVNGYGYSDVHNSAVVHPHYLLLDLINLLFVEEDPDSLTYIKEELL